MKGKISAHAQPDGDGLQVTYETEDSRRLHRFPKPESEKETPPHGAGSFHDPEHHRELMDRVEAMREKGTNPR